MSLGKAGDLEAPTDGFVDFGIDDEPEDGEPKPLSGRRKKAAMEMKRKSKPGTFGEGMLVDFSRPSSTC